MKHDRTREKEGKRERSAKKGVERLLCRENGHYLFFYDIIGPFASAESSLESTDRVQLSNPFCRLDLLLFSVQWMWLWH